MEFVLFFAVLIALSVITVPIMRRKSTKDKQERIRVAAFLGLFYLLLGVVFSYLFMFWIGMLFLSLAVVIIAAA